jgi:hypothetical protein
MPHLKQANAMVVHPRVSYRGWSRVRKASSSGSSENLTDRAREILGGSLDPSKFLFTHCTIVASVDTEVVPDVRLGKVKLGSTTIDRRYNDYFIKPECSQFVNNNGDSWSREVLKMAYPTFVGAHNFQEHVQIEEKSKGKIIDAVARDVGDSLYVDILVATDRKHASLIEDIESGKLGTLSMGCFLPGTMVSLADGTRIPIEEIQPGDMVLTHKGRARPVANVQIRRRHWTMRRLNAVGVPEEIVTTDTHPFFVYRSPKTCACGCGEPLLQLKSDVKQTTRYMERRFKTGHDKRIYNPRANYSPEEKAERKARLASLQEMVLEEVPAGELQEDDFLVFPRAFLGEELDFGITPGRARLLGYFLAEGSFLKDNGERVEVEFSLSSKEAETYAAEIMNLLAAEFPNARAPRLYLEEHRGACTVRLYSKEAAAWFYEYGGEYSHKKRLKEEVLRWPVNLQKEMVGAWINGDGHLCKDGTSGGVTTSYDLYCQLHLIMSRCGAFVTAFADVDNAEGLQTVNGSVVSVRQENGKLPAYELRLGHYQSQVFAGYTDKIRPSPYWKSQSNRVKEDLVLFPLRSNTAEPFFGFVYDLEVEEDHSYVVEGVAVHNCVTDFTVCSQCGHYAVDASDLCQHIRYSKLNTFLDDSGKKRVIAELCGHKSYKENPEAPGGVRFIEASWVAVPAFTGAVMHQILDPKGTGVPEGELRRLLAAPTQGWSDSAISKAASQHLRAFEFGEEDAEGEKPEAPEAPEDPFKKLEDQVFELITNRVQDRFKSEMLKAPAKKQEALAPSDAPNDSIIKEGSRKQAQALYAASLGALVRTASSQAALVDGVAEINRACGIRVAKEVYRAVLEAGPMSKFASPDHYLTRLKRSTGRDLSLAELRVVVRVGTLLSRWESNNNPHRN